jgi:glycosyltransferase involved in cell wall biosynthesis
MKVLFFVRALTVGGSERQLALSARGLAQRGHDVAIAVLYGGGALEALLQGSSVRILSIDKSGRWHLASPLAKMFRIFLRERPDVVYAFLPVQTTLAALLLPPYLKTRLVFGLRAALMDLRQYDRLHALAYRLEAWLSRRAHLIVANAAAVRADAMVRGMPADRIVVVPNGIDTDTMAPDRLAGDAQRQSWGIDKRAFVVGLVARLDPMKDHPTFLAAAAEFARHHPDAQFVCVGDGPAAYRDQLVALAQSLGLQRRIFWVGELHDLRAVYNAFDLVTLSSSFGEGFPNVVAEAMACGVPVAATDVGDVRTIIGRHGEVVPRRRPDLLSQAWARLRDRLMQDQDLRVNARNAIVSAFTVGAMAERTEAVLLHLCGHHTDAGSPAC